MQERRASLQGRGSVLHKIVQSYICHALPPGSTKIEYMHCSLNRIIDIFWTQENIGFEIQCSPISLEEIKARCSDYKRANILVIWILHQKTFNKKYLPLSEFYLRHNEICYYTNISLTGNGYIYDQKDFLYNRMRTQVSAHHPINISSLSAKKQSRTSFPFPLLIKKIFHL